MIPPTAKPARLDRVLVSQMGQEGVLLDPATDGVAYCSPTALLIYELCNGERTIEEMVTLLRDAFPDAAQDMQQDVLTGLQQLADAGFIRL